MSWYKTQKQMIEELNLNIFAKDPISKVIDPMSPIDVHNNHYIMELKNREAYAPETFNGSLIEKSLTDVNAVDADGKAVIDPLTGKQMIELGLKSIWIAKTKEIAQYKLNKHDWMITRKAEKGTEIPSDVTTYRDAVRTKCASIDTAINNCSNLTQFMALFDAPVDSDGNPTGDNAPINDFPDEI